MRLEFEPPQTFQDTLIPEGAQLVGWAALVYALRLQAPVRQPSCVSQSHIRGSHRIDGGWRVFDKRYMPGDNFTDHLNFALRHESFRPFAPLAEETFAQNHRRNMGRDNPVLNA